MGYRETIINRPVLENPSLKATGNHRLLKMGHVVATGGAGATVEIEDNAGETIADRGGTGITLVLASDTDDAAYDTKSVTIHYINTSGLQKTCAATYNAADSRTEVAFTDTTTSVAVSDFACPDVAHYGTLAVVSTVAVQGGDNVCIGATGCVAGIADPDICFIKILAAATSPTIANMWGIGAISGDEAANQDDAGWIWYEEYVTVWGQIKHGTWTFPADSSVSTRLVSVEDMAIYVAAGNASTTMYVNDFYRRRDSYLVNASGVSVVALDECRIGDWDAAALYNAIEVGQSKVCHSRHYVARVADVTETYIRKCYFTYQGAAAEYCTLTLTFVQYNQAGTTTISHRVFGGQAFTLNFDVQLKEKTEVKAIVVDDAAAGGNFTFQMDILEVY
jgi:hypothetical protein